MTHSAGWNVIIDSSGTITATPPLGVQPGDYPILVAAQSVESSHPLWATAVHTATVTAHEGLALSVALDPLTTVPWAQTGFSFPGDDEINNGQPQVSGTAFIATITNTSSVAHTYNVQIVPTGFSADWILLGGAGRTATTEVSLPPGGSGQLGVYISPVGLAALPAEGTQYPFNVVATAVTNTDLTASDDDIFTMPAVQFAHVAAQPELIYSAPSAATSFEVTVTNVGNTTTEFPLTVDMPISDWTIVDGWNVPTLAPGGASTQAITLTTTSGELGQVYVVGAGSQSGPYRPTSYVGVEMVSAEALPIYQAASQVAGPCAIGDNQVSLPAALRFLALSMTDLKLSCQTGSCALDLRDRVISGALASATHTAELSPLVTVDALLEQLAADMATHSDAAMLNNDMSSLGNAIVQLEGEVCAISQHQLTASFVPGTNVTLAQEPANYELRLVNEGSETTTANITLAPSTGATTSWVNYTAVLAPGEELSIPVVVTPMQLGTFIIKAEIDSSESTVVRYETNAVLTAVDSLLEIINVAPVPPFIEVGSGASAMIMAEVANVANIPVTGEAIVQLFDSNGSEVYSSAPQPIAFDSALIPLSYEAGSIASSGLLTDTYSVVVTVLDENGELIPNATGQGLLSVGQLLSASSRVEPALVAPGDATVTTIIDTELNESILDLFASVVRRFLTLTKTTPSSKIAPPTDKSNTTPKQIAQPLHKENQNYPATILRNTALLTGTVDLATSSISVTSAHVADGVDAATITVTALDEFGNPVADTAVWLTASGVGHTFTSAQGSTDANGVFTATLTSTQPGAKVIRALLGDGVDMAWLPDTPIIEFTGGTISGLIFSDANRDGDWQAGEAGLGGVQVNLYQSGEADPWKQLVSQSDGQYSFSSLLPGTYQVEQTRLDEYALSGNNVLTVTVAGLTAVSDINFGNYAAAQVSGQVWVDSDQNGQIGTGEDPIAGVTVNVYDEASQLLDSTATAFDGSYRFDLAADLPIAPDNFVFNKSGVMLSEPATAVIANYDFTRGVTPQDSATYPTNYDFAIGDLDSWTVDNTSYVAVISDSFSLNGSYLQIQARHWANTAEFVVPAATQSVQLDYSNWDTRNPDYDGRVEVWVYSDADFSTQDKIANLDGSENEGWQTAVIDLQDYQGETIKLHFYATEDYDRIRLDNITLQTLVPDWTTDNTRYVTVISDTFNTDGPYLQIQARHWANSSAFTVPTETQSLRLDYSNWDTRNPNYGGRVEVWIYSGSNFSIQQKIANLDGSENEGWKTAVLDLQDYQGEIIKLHFYATEDYDRIRLDNMGLYLETPSWTLSNAANVSIGHNTNTGDSVSATLENSDFNAGRLRLYTPDNGDYSYEVAPLDPTTYPANYDFTRSVTPQDPATYPANYDFATGDLDLWTADNPAYVTVVSNTFNLDGHHLQIQARHWVNSSPFVVPAETQSIQLDYSNWDTRNPDYDGRVEVWVYSGSDFRIQEKIANLDGSENEGWQTAVLDLQDYQDEIIKLHFYATEDYDQIRLDNITLQTSVPDWTADNMRYVAVISDTFNLNGAHLQIQARHWANSPTFVVPAETQSLQLDYSNWDTRSPNYDGRIEVWVYSGPGFGIQEKIANLDGSENDDWKTAVLDLQDYQNETIQLHFYVTEDYDRARMDNLTLLTSVPDWTADNTSHVTVISDTFNLDGSYLQIAARHWAESPAFVVPADTQSVQLDYSNWDTRNPDYDGRVEVWVYSGPSFSIQEKIANLDGSENKGWQTAVLNLQDYQGKTIKLHFYATEDYDRIRLDNVGLYLETPSWTLSDAANAAIEASIPLPNVETYLPDNPNFDTGRTEYTTLTNHDFSYGVTPQDPETYPTNYDFTHGVTLQDGCVNDILTVAS